MYLHLNKQPFDENDKTTVVFLFALVGGWESSWSAWFLEVAVLAAHQSDPIIMLAQSLDSNRRSSTRRGDSLREVRGADPKGS